MGPRLARHGRGPDRADRNRATFGASGFELVSAGDSCSIHRHPRCARLIDVVSVTLRRAPFADDIEAISAAGITSGYGDGRFGPNDGVTRAQMAAFLVSGLELPSAGSAGFSDRVWSLGREPDRRLAAAGITSGYGDGRFGPNDGVTRAQMAAFLVRGLWILVLGGFSWVHDVSGIGPRMRSTGWLQLASLRGTGMVGLGRMTVSRVGRWLPFLAEGASWTCPPVVTRAERGSNAQARRSSISRRNVKLTGTPAGSGRSRVLIRSSVPQAICQTSSSGTWRPRHTWFWR